MHPSVDRWRLRSSIFGAIKCLGATGKAGMLGRSAAIVVFRVRSNWQLKRAVLEFQGRCFFSDVQLSRLAEEWAAIAKNVELDASLTSRL